MRPEQYRAGEQYDAIRQRLDSIVQELATVMNDAEVQRWLQTGDGQRWLSEISHQIREADPVWLDAIEEQAAEEMERRLPTHYADLEDVA